MRTFFYFVLGLFVVIVSSCAMAHLDKYPGTRLDSIPENMRGSFYLKLIQNSHDPSDSITIKITKNGWSYKEGNKGETYVLSEKTVVSKIHDFYAISVVDDNLKQFWNTWVVIPKNKKMKFYPIVSIGHKPAADKLSNYLKRNVITEMPQRDSVFYYEMNDAAFIKYFEKEIKHSKTFEIIRIKDKK